MSYKLTRRERFAIDLAIRHAERCTRMEFSVFMGETDVSTRPHALALHRSLVAPSRSVLLLVEPLKRRTELVTGNEVSLPGDVAAGVLDHAASSFQSNGLAAGIVAAVRTAAAAIASTRAGT